jgi:hypothetical protein
LTEPFRFITQVFNSLETLKKDQVAPYESISVTVYIGKGDHYLFTCATGFSADLSGYNSG